MDTYVHGYAQKELQRLSDQSQTLQHLLHHDTHYPTGSLVLEAGCGVGAQTIHLQKQSPHATIISMDLSKKSLDIAQESVHGLSGHSGIFVQGNIFSLPFQSNSFDHIFICFVLEHLTHPVEALTHLKTLLKDGGTLTVIEGDHGSCFYTPRSEKAQRVWELLIRLQHDLGGNALIGRELYPILHEAGFSDIEVNPRVVYVDDNYPQLQEGFVRKTIIAMVEGVKEKAIEQELISRREWEEGIADLHQTGHSPAGTFFYTFFKGVCKKS